MHLYNKHPHNRKPHPARDSAILTPAVTSIPNGIELTVCEEVRSGEPTTGAYKNSFVKQASPSKSNELTIKVHTDLLTNLVQSRELNNRYQTNKLLKLAGAYYILKSLTPSGVIKHYHQQIDQLCAYLNCTPPTLYKTLRECKKRGFLTYNARSIILKSWTEFTASLDVIFTQFTEIKYNYREQKIEHVLESAFLQIREKARAKVFENKVRAVPELKQELDNLINPDQNGNYQTALKALQIEAFKYGHEKMYSIFYLNPFTTCNEKTLREMFGFKSQQSVAYLKSKLQRKKLANVTEVRIPSQNTQRVKHLFIIWDNGTKQTIWIQPDRWEYAPILSS